MLLKRHDTELKIAITGIALVVAIVVMGMEVNARHEFNALAAQRDLDLERNKPFYDCLIAAMATVEESSPEVEQRAAVVDGDECYERYDKQMSTPPR